MAKRLSKTSYKQYEELLNFVVQNKIILSGKTKPLEAKKIESLWTEFAIHINGLGYGTQKTPQQWRHVFNEWKTNTKRKSRELRKEMNGTGGGPAVKKPLTDLEEKLLSIISYIHLGDNEVRDSMDVQDEATGTFCHFDIGFFFHFKVLDVLVEYVENDHNYLIANNENFEGICQIYLNVYKLATFFRNQQQCANIQRHS
ncbi:hypothetical protein RI129_005280 [Pyrocoelia pectoralis]|uniref:Regulatory protein zeste n=1 Tax=Pyrocoelia pectoralis TaxID=417401 RepID=A0AAN7VKL5_9COLE